MRRPFRRALTALAILSLALIAVAWALLSSTQLRSWLRVRLESELRLALGPGATLAEVDTEPWGLALRARDVHVPIGKASFIRCRSIRTRLDLWALLGRRVQLRGVDLEQAVLDLDLDDPDLGERFAPRGGGTGFPRLGTIRLQGSELRLRSRGFRLLLGEIRGRIHLKEAVPGSAVLAMDIRGLAVDNRELGPGRADLEAEISRDGGFDVRSLQATLAPGPFRVRGRIGASDRALELSLVASVDAGKLVRALGGQNQLGGRAQVQGRLLGLTTRPTFRGTLRAPQLLAVGQLPLLEVEGKLTADASGFELHDGKASLFGGGVEFRAFAPLRGGRPVGLDYRVRGLDLARVRAQISNFPLRAGRLDLDGSMELTHRGRPTTLDARALATDVEPALRDELDDPRLRHMLAPFSGSAQLHFESSVLSVRDAELRNVWTHATGEGVFPLEGSIDCRIALADSDLAAVTLTSGPAFAWLGTESRYRLGGTIDGSLHWTGPRASPRLEYQGMIARAEIEGPRLDGTPAAAAVAGTSLRLLYQQRSLLWSAEGAGDTRFQASGQADFPEQEVMRQRLRFRSTDWDAARLARAVDFPLPWQGEASAAGEFAHDGQQWTGELRLDGNAGPLGRGFGRTEATIEVSQDGLRFPHLLLATPHGRIEGSGSLDESDRGLDLELRAHDLPLAAAFADARHGVEGLATGTIRLRGSWPAVDIEGGFTLAGVHLRDVPLGDFVGTLTGTRDLLVVTTRRDPDLDLTLSLALAPPWPWTLKGMLDNLEIGPILASALPSARLLPEGRVTATIEASGQLRAPSPIARVSLTASSATLSLGGVELRAAEPFSLGWSPGEAVTLSPLRLLGLDTDLRLVGFLDSATLAADLNVRGQTELRLVRSLLGQANLSGLVEIDARLTGPPSRPSLDGTARLTRGYVRTQSLPFPLRDIEASATLTGQTVRLDTLEARFGGGRLRAVGDLSFADPAGPRGRLSVSGEALQLTLFRDLELRTDAEVVYELAPQMRRLGGTLHVTRAVYRAPRTGFSSGGGTSALAGGADALALAGFPETRLDLEVAGDGNLWYVSDEAKIEGDAVIRIGGTTAAPTVLGSIRYLSQARLKLEGRHYRVLRGFVVFDNPRELDPRIDFEAETTLRGYRIVLGLTGRLRSLQVTARSDPPLAQGDVLSLLVGGKPEEGFGVVGPTGSQEIFRSLFLPQAVGALTGGRVLIDPTALSGRADPTEVLPLSIPVGESLDVTAGLPLSEARPGLFILNWRPWRGFALLAIRDLDRGWGAELVHERRFGGDRAREPESSVVSALHIDAPGVETADILDELELKIGSRVTRAAQRADAERLAAALRRRGWPLAQIGSALVRDPEGNSAEVSYTVDPGPRVLLETPGARLSKEERERLLGTVETFGLYEETDSELERVARQIHEEKGYARCLVSCAQIPLEEGRPDVRMVCEIDPGRRYTVRAITFDGMHFFRPAEVATQIRTRQELFRTARLVTADVGDDVRHLEWLYHEEGFLDAASRAEVRQGADEQELELVFHVEEGERWKVGTIDIVGTTPVPSPELAQLLGLDPGDAFRAPELRAGRDRISSHHDGLGYMQARVRMEATRDAATHSVAVRIHVHAGELTRVNKIRIEGLRRTSARVVERELRFAPGELLSYDRIARSQGRLYELGIFRFVEIRSQAAGPGLHDVVVRVEEVAPYRLELGGGYDTGEGPRGSFEISDTNLGGRGRFLGLQLSASPLIQRGQLLYREPRALGLPVAGTLTASYEHRDEVSFDEDRLYFRGEAARLFGRQRRNRTTLRYTLADTRLSNLEVSPSEAGAEDLRLSSFGAALALDRRDNVLEPRHGWLASGDIEWASSLIGSEADLVKLTLKAFAYRTLTRRLVWASGAQIGLGFAPGAEARLPLAERYFAGGATTLRGLGFNLAGPLDAETGKPSGGNALVVLNSELRFDLIRQLVSSLFVDAGEVFRTTSSIRPSEFRWTVGLGLRYRGPVLAGLDYARLISPRPEESHDQLHFTLGHAF